MAKVWDASKGLIDDDSIPHLPKLGYGLNKKFIETYWAYKKSSISSS